MRRLTLITLSVLLLATVAGAQTPEQSRDNLKTLREGEKIQVVDQKLKSQNGTFVSFSEEAITFQADKDAVTIQRADVFRVSSREHPRRGHSALVGLGVGAAVGAAAGAAVGAALGEGGDLGRALTAGLGALYFAPVGAGIGAGLGAAFSSSYPTIYRAERRKDKTAP
ncbi:MAG: hypothetical protein HY648_02665 [Acidobacteria bacterium]|nr:hypothetical protein [Acidobacteriota bacterium]